MLSWEVTDGSIQYSNWDTLLQYNITVGLNICQTIKIIPWDWIIILTSSSEKVKRKFQDRQMGESLTVY